MGMYTELIFGASILSVINNDFCIHIDGTWSIHSGGQKTFTQSEVDAIRADTWNGARYLRSADFHHTPYFHESLEDYLSSLNLNTNDTVAQEQKEQINIQKEFVAPASLAQHPRCKPTNDNAFVWDAEAAIDFHNFVFRHENQFLKMGEYIEQFIASKQSAPVDTWKDNFLVITPEDKEASALPTKEWQIESFISERGDIIQNNYDGTFGYGFAHIEPAKMDYFMQNPIYKIHSVRRLSDNTVWQVGEIFSNNSGGIYTEEKICAFKIENGEMVAYQDKECAFRQPISKI